MHISRKLNALNEHIAREAEHHNPDYMNIELFDAGTSLKFIHYGLRKR